MTRVLERGDIYFAYRPRIGQEHPRGLEAVQRLFVVLHPRETDLLRRLVVGRKRMPDIGEHERSWAFVDRVARSPGEIGADLERTRYLTRTRGEREVPPARPAGEGAYAIVAHGGHTHLAYQLVRPDAPGEVQADLGIAPVASYVIVVRNPQAPGPVAPGRRPELPRRLLERFAGRRFAPLEPDFLDREGTELILIGAHEAPDEELDLSLDPEEERAGTADIFRDLGFDRDQHPARPLFDGVWE